MKAFLYSVATLQDGRTNHVPERILSGMIDDLVPSTYIHLSEEAMINIHKEHCIDLLMLRHRDLALLTEVKDIENSICSSLAMSKLKTVFSSGSQACIDRVMRFFQTYDETGTLMRNRAEVVCNILTHVKDWRSFLDEFWSLLHSDDMSHADYRGYIEGISLYLSANGTPHDVARALEFFDHVHDKVDEPERLLSLNAHYYVGGHHLWYHLVTKYEQVPSTTAHIQYMFKLNSWRAIDYLLENNELEFPHRKSMNITCKIKAYGLTTDEEVLACAKILKTVSRYHVLFEIADPMVTGAYDKLVACWRHTLQSEGAGVWGTAAEVSVAVRSCNQRWISDAAFIQYAHNPWPPAMLSLAMHTLQAKGDEMPFKKKLKFILWMYDQTQQRVDPRRGIEIGGYGLPLYNGAWVNRRETLLSILCSALEFGSTTLEFVKHAYATWNILPNYHAVMFTKNIQMIEWFHEQVIANPSLGSSIQFIVFLATSPESLDITIATHAFTKRLLGEARTDQLDMLPTFAGEELFKESSSSFTGVDYLLSQNSQWMRRMCELEKIQIVVLSFPSCAVNVFRKHNITFTENAFMQCMPRTLQHLKTVFSLFSTEQVEKWVKARAAVYIHSAPVQDDTPFLEEGLLIFDYLFKTYPQQMQMEQPEEDDGDLTGARSLLAGSREVAYFVKHHHVRV